MQGVQEVAVDPTANREKNLVFQHTGGRELNTSILATFSDRFTASYEALWIEPDRLTLLILTLDWGVERAWRVSGFCVWDEIKTGKGKDSATFL